MPSQMEHSELVAEITTVEKMSTHDRLKHAKKRRQQQMKRFAAYEKALGKESNKKGRNKNNKVAKKKARSSTRVHFVSSVMLLDAAARNDVEEVRGLLQKNVSPDVTNEDGLTALHQCCIDDSEEMMKLLIEFGANVNARDTELWTPLHAAATCGHVHLCRYLVENGAELLSVNADGNMPYDICEDEVTLDYIESEMAKRDVTQELIDETRLSTEKNMLQDLKALADKGGDLEVLGRYGETALHIAAANGYVQVCEFLLDHHVAIDIADDDSWLPIHAAACWGHLPILELLLNHGADLEVKTKTGETPVDICEDPELKQRLIEMKDEIEANRTTRHSEHRQRRSLNTRRSGTFTPPNAGWSTSSMYSSNTSLSGDKNPFSASVRRTSMREKSALSWKEAREEARLRGSVGSDDEDDDEDRTQNMNGNKIEPIPMSNIDEVNLNETIEESPTSSSDKIDTTTERESTPWVNSSSSSVSAAAAEWEAKGKLGSNNNVQSNKELTKVGEEVRLEDIHPSEDVVHKNDLNIDRIDDVASDYSGSQSSKLTQNGQTPHKTTPQNTPMKEIQITPPTSSSPRPSLSTTAPPSGTLADLKRMRALQLQNRFREHNTSSAGNGSFLETNSTTGQIKPMSTSTVLPANERNGHSPSVPTDTSNSTKPSPYMNTVPMGDPPKRRFTATSPSEIVGADDNKNSCCVIL